MRSFVNSIFCSNNFSLNQIFVKNFDKFLSASFFDSSFNTECVDSFIAINFCAA